MSNKFEAQSRPLLKRTRLILRAPQPSDKQDRLACGRDPEEVRMYGGDDRSIRPLTLEEVEAWHAEFCANPLSWVIEVDGRCIGNVLLHSLDEENRRARYAIGIFNRDYRDKGIGTEATRLVLRYAF